MTQPASQGERETQERLKEHPNTDDEGVKQDPETGGFNDDAENQVYGNHGQDRQKQYTGSDEQPEEPATHEVVDQPRAKGLSADVDPLKEGPHPDDRGHHKERLSQEKQANQSNSGGGAPG